jgi:hypothetical protein
VFTPCGNSYKFEGKLAIGALMAGIVGVPPCDASPTGRVDMYELPLVGATQPRAA